MTTYNGYRSWNAWNVSLWINNDEGLYQMAKEFISVGYGKDWAACAMKAELPATTPDGAPYSVSSIRAALVGM